MATEDTKERIMDAGECLFADHGFGSTSLRMITAEAGVNLASVNYHFGSKEALLSAIIERRIGPLNQARLAMLEDIEQKAGDSPPDVEEIIRAFLRPALDRLKQISMDSNHFMKLAGRMHTEVNPKLRSLFIHHFEDVFRRFQDAIQKALPNCNPVAVSLGLLFSVGAMIKAITLDPALAEKMTGTKDRPTAEELAESLVRFTAAGFRDGLAANCKGEAP